MVKTALPVNALCTIASGLMLAGALPHLDWGWLAWFALVPFLLRFPFRTLPTAFGYGVLLGAVYLGGMSYWVAVFAAPIIGSALSVLGWVVLTLCEAFFIGLWAMGAQWLCTRPNPWAFRLGAPALWAVIEWGRQWGTLGLSWGDLAYMQHAALPILQVTKLTGIWGLAFLIVAVNVALTETLKARRLTPFACGTAGAVGLALVYGALTLRAENLRPTFVAAALQGNINQNTDHSPAYVSRVMQTFGEQSRTAAQAGAALTIWPETAFPGYLLTDLKTQAQVQHDAQASRQTVVIGGAEYDWEQRKAANSLFLMKPDGTMTGSYQKQQLVPFGEYTPGTDFFPFLKALNVTGGDFKAGGDAQALLDGGPKIGKIGAAICFESSYPRILQDQVARGAGLLVVSTDDAWFGRTAAARQHSAIAAVRAAETDRYLIRSAATGVSQIIAPSGQVLAEAGLFRPAVVSAPVEARTTTTPYVRWGDWFVVFCALLLGVLVTVSFRQPPPPGI